MVISPEKNKVRFIYNPTSGETAVADQLDDIIAVYQKQGLSIMPYRLDFKAGNEGMLDGVDDSFHHLLVAGGDGTVNYVVNRMKAAGMDIPIGILPAGTANDFASMLGIAGTDMAKVCKSLLAGEIRSVDLGRVNGDYFVNVLSCGLFTDVSQKTPTILKNTLGKMAYYLGGLGELTNFHKMNLHIESDGGDYDGSSVIFFVFNGRTAGNIRIAYLAEVDDGMLDVMIVKGDNAIETMQTIMHYMAAPNYRKKYPSGIVHIRCSRLTAECQTKENIDVDGQAGPGFPLEIVCEKGGLQVLRPKDKAKRTRKNRKKEAGAE